MVTRSMKRFTVAVAAMAAVIFLAVPAPAQAATGVNVVSTTISGTVVKVSVRNSSAAPYTGYVGVKALVGGTAVWSFVPVVVFPNQCTSVSAGFSGTVGGVATVGMTDSPTPF
jgi:membrane associated rhomboid family serine protease